MNSEYDFCSFDGCQKKVLNASGRCPEHRLYKCDVPACRVKITRRQGGKFCDKHMKKKPREEVDTWSLGV